jgi:hypothetical protein
MLARSSMQANCTRGPWPEAILQDSRVGSAKSVGAPYACIDYTMFTLGLMLSHAAAQYNPVAGLQPAWECRLSAHWLRPGG